MEKGSILIFAQDTGGAKYMIPVLRHLFSSGRITQDTVIAHRYSQDLFQQNGIAFRAMGEVLEHTDGRISEWERYLRDRGIKRVFCGTSSPYLDPTNSNLISACKKKKIPVMGIMDHWKGLDRFCDGNYVPDYICCIDDNSASALKLLGMKPGHIFVTGHPHLESIKACGQMFFDGQVRILLVSQPITGDRSFKGIFFVQICKKPIIQVLQERINDVVQEMGLTHELCIRYHPKEDLSLYPPSGIKKDLSISIEEAISNYDIFIGINSMALLEANLAGKMVIPLAFPDFLESGDEGGACLPMTSVSMDEFGMNLKQLFSTRMDGKLRNKLCQEMAEAFSGSIEKTSKVVIEFLFGNSIVDF